MSRKLTEKVQASFTPAERAQLEALARDDSRSVASLIRLAVRAYIDNIPDETQEES